MCHIVRTDINQKICFQERQLAYSSWLLDVSERNILSWKQNLSNEYVKRILWPFQKRSNNKYLFSFDLSNHWSIHNLWTKNLFKDKFRNYSTIIAASEAIKWSDHWWSLEFILWNHLCTCLQKKLNYLFNYGN